MKKKIYTTPIKVTAMFLLVLITVFVLLEIVALVVLSENNAFFDNGVSLRRIAYESAAQEAFDEVMDRYISPRLDGYNDSFDYIAERYSPENSNLFFEITDDGGNLLYRNYSESDYRYKEVIGKRIVFVSESVYNGGSYWNDNTNAMDSTLLEETANRAALPTDGRFENGIALPVVPAEEVPTDFVTENTDTESIVEAPPGREVTLTFTAAVRTTLTAKDPIYYMLGLADFIVVHRVEIAVTCVIGLILAIILFIYLLCSAGHHRNADGKDEIAPEILDTIPLDLYAVFVFWVSLAFAYVAVEALLINLFSLLLRLSTALVCVICV